MVALLVALALGIPRDEFSEAIIASDSTRAFEDMHESYHSYCPGKDVCRLPNGGCIGGFTNDESFTNDPWCPYVHNRGPAPPTHFPLQPASCSWAGTSKRIALVHVGKSAGMSLYFMLQRSGLNFTHVHDEWAIQNFDPAGYDLFVVSMRDPIKRTIATFNWAHPIGGAETGAGEVPADVGYRSWRTSFGPLLRETLDCFPQLPGGVSAFAEALNQSAAPGRCGIAARLCMLDPYCTHFGNNLGAYVNRGVHYGGTTLLDRVRDGSAHGSVVMTESFAVDVSRMWDFLCVPPHARPSDTYLDHAPGARHNDTAVSAAGMSELRAWTESEYAILQELQWEVSR